MPRIPDDALKSVVFIYPSQEAAAEGLQAGGSGVIVYADTGVRTWNVRYVVTNEHVVSRGGHWVRLNCVHGIHVVNVPARDWIVGPDGDDFAIAPLRLDRHVTHTQLRIEDWGLTKQMAAALAVGPGDEVYMVGRFIGHGGRVTNNPVARFGSIALMPNVMEPVRDGRGRDVEAYLVEMRSHSGFSGSPVFLMIPQMSFRGVVGDTSLEDNQTKFRLLGIDTGHMIEDAPVQVKDQDGWQNVPNHRVAINSDMAIVTPIWKVVDLLNREDLVEQRRKIGEDLLRRSGGEQAESDMAIDPDTEPESFERPLTKQDFETALRKVSRRKPSPPDEETSGT